MDQEEETRMVTERECSVNFIMSRLTQALATKDFLMKELEEKKQTDFTISMKGPSGLKLIGTIIIKEEE